jgi:hypothetical protein
MRANIMSDVHCEQRGRSMGVSWSATLSVTDKGGGGPGGDAETVRLVGRARKLIRAGTIKNPDGDEGSGRRNDVERVFNSSRKDKHWGQRKLKRTNDSLDLRRPTGRRAIAERRATRAAATDPTLRAASSGER